MKRCTKGKSCGATCIDRRERCVLELGPSVNKTTNKVVSLIQRSSQTAAPTIDSLSKEFQEEAKTHIETVAKKLEERQRIGNQFFMKDPEGLVEWNKKMEPLENLTDAQRAAIGFYVSNKGYYKDVNQFLRTGKEAGDPERDKLVKFTAQNLKEGTANLPAKATELDRAVSGKFAQQLENLKVGTVIEDKGFGSYTNKGHPTLDMFLSKVDSNAILNVKSKTARDISLITQYNEGEHLISPGGKFRVVDIQPKGFYSRKTGGYLPYYFLEEI
jgi:NAD:arginine ADP-ribosyltransferase